MRRHTTGLAILAAAALLAACSGAPRPQALKAGGKEAGRTSSGAGTGGADGQGGGAAGAGDAAGSTATTTAGSGTAGGGKVQAGRTGGSGVAGGSGTGGRGPGGPGAPQPGDATLFSAAQNTRGITANEIRLCGHAALLLAKAFNTDVADLNVYWEYLNAHGGIYNRQVKANWYDDQYDGAQAKASAIKCAGENPFLILGGIGFDQIPNVRVWADQEHELYIHHIAVGKGAENLRYSFTMQPTVEDTGRAFGEYITKHHGNRSIGVVYRGSENWTPGSDVAESYMKAHGVRIVARRAVTKNQGVYANEIGEMIDKKAEVVFLWENALGAEQFIEQSHQQGYHPVFVVFPFQTTLDLLGDSAFKSPIEGVSTWPAYKPGGYPNAWPEHKYNDEIRAFETAMHELRPSSPPNDILWQTWLGFKQLHDMFLLCGKDCTRNRFAGLMLNGYKTVVEPNCGVDFTRGNHHRGAWDFMTMLAFKAEDGKPYYKTTQWCSEHLS